MSDPNEALVRQLLERMPEGPLRPSKDDETDVVLCTDAGEWVANVGDWGLCVYRKEQLGEALSPPVKVQWLETVNSDVANFFAASPDIARAYLAQCTELRHLRRQRRFEGVHTLLLLLLVALLLGGGSYLLHFLVYEGVTCLTWT